MCVRANSNPVNCRLYALVGLIYEGALSEGGFNRKEKSTSKQAIAVLIKIRFAFTGFNYALKLVNKSNSRLYTLREACIRGDL